MTKQGYFLWILLITSFITLFHSSNAFATLGMPATSVTNVSKKLKIAQKNTVSHDLYTVQVLESSATTIREYVSPSGIVFGIAWNGRKPPNLEPLLGTYFAEYKKSIEKNSPNGKRKNYQTKSSSLVVENGGRMRSLYGRLYDPTLIPAGVSASDIQ